MFWDLFKKEPEKKSSEQNDPASFKIKLSASGLTLFSQLHTRIEKVYQKKIDIIRTWDIIITAGIKTVNDKLDKHDPPQPKKLRVVRNDDPE